MKLKIILCLLPLLLTACAGINFKDTSETKAVVRQVCPDVTVLSTEQQTTLADIMTYCLAPQPADNQVCRAFIVIMTQYEMARDQARVCYAQK